MVIQFLWDLPPAAGEIHEEYIPPRQSEILAYHFVLIYILYMFKFQNIALLQL